MPSQNSSSNSADKGYTTTSSGTNSQVSSIHPLDALPHKMISWPNSNPKTNRATTTAAATTAPRPATRTPTTTPTPMAVTTTPTRTVSVAFEKASYSKCMSSRVRDVWLILVA